MLLSTGVMAQSTMYVGDEVQIPMRSDASITKDNIIAKLGIHTPVILLKKKSNGWSQIKYKDIKGWMITRYLTDVKPTNLKAQLLDSQIAKLEQKNKTQQQLITKLNTEINQQRKSSTALNTQAAQYDAQVIQANKLRNKITNLDQVNVDLMDQIKRIKAKNSAMHSTDFLTIVTTLMLLLGLGIGYMINKANKRDNIYSI